jgi:hypothetical protein
MAAAMKVSKIEAKSHDKPDEVITPSKTRVEVVRLKDARSVNFSARLALV